MTDDDVPPLATVLDMRSVTYERNDGKEVPHIEIEVETIDGQEATLGFPLPIARGLAEDFSTMAKQAEEDDVVT